MTEVHSTLHTAQVPSAYIGDHPEPRETIHVIEVHISPDAQWRIVCQDDGETWCIDASTPLSSVLIKLDVEQLTELAESIQRHMM